MVKKDYDGPTTIYLQYHHPNLDYPYDIEWCHLKINDSDIEFVTAVQLHDANKRIEKLEKQIAEYVTEMESLELSGHLYLE